MSLANGFITRLQDANDVNVTTGVGVDEYALVYDHDTAKFVLRAMSAGVTDHGLLTGLGDDDHSQYLLVTGTRAMTGALSIPLTTVGDKVVIDCTNVGATGAGRQSIKFGRSASSRTIEMGAYSANATYAGATFAVYSNELSQYFLTAYGGKIGIGNITELAATIEARYNVATDYLIGNFLNTGGSTSGVTDNVLRMGRETSNRYIDIGVRGEAYFQTPAFLVKRVTDNTNTSYTMQIIDCQTTATPAAGYGAGLLWQLQSDTTISQNAARIQAITYEVAHGTRKYDLVGTAFDAGGEREGWRVRGTGSAAAIGFLGATPATMQAHVADPSGGATVDAEARSAINSILATLETFGFHATS